MTSSRDSVDLTLNALGADMPLPPLSPDLEAELEHLEPVEPRRPARMFAALVALSVLYGAVLLFFFELRVDLSGLSPVWIALYCGAWLAGFLALGWLALVPARRRIMPNWRWAGTAAVLSAAGYITAGLLFHQHVPGVSHLCQANFGELVAHSPKCLGIGMLTAAVPVLLGALLLRGSVPVGSRWAGAGLGAAGGALGGLTLHLHCHHADPLHLGLVHGGVVVLAGLLGALVIPRMTRV